MATKREAATLGEARALAHPVRLRILRLCLHEERTNQELAASLGLRPATTLHHVRTLLNTGFLVEGRPRPGPRGSTEKPYRATRKSWRVDVADTGEERAVETAVLEAVAAEIEAAGPAGVLAQYRLGLRLPQAAVDELVGRVDRLAEDYAGMETAGDDGEPVALFVVVHRQP